MCVPICLPVLNGLKRPEVIRRFEAPCSPFRYFCVPRQDRLRAKTQLVESTVPAKSDVIIDRISEVHYTLECTRNDCGRPCKLAMSWLSREIRSNNRSAWRWDRGGSIHRRRPIRLDYCWFVCSTRNALVARIYCRSSSRNLDRCPRIEDPNRVLVSRLPTQLVPP